MSEPYIVIVTFEAKPRKELKLKETLYNLIKISKTDPGCLEYHLYRGINFPARFVLYGKWQNEQTYQEHLQQPHVCTFAQKLDALLAKFPEIILSVEI